MYVNKGAQAPPIALMLKKSFNKAFDPELNFSLTEKSSRAWFNAFFLEYFFQHDNIYNSYEHISLHLQRHRQLLRLY